MDAGSKRETVSIDVELLVDSIRPALESPSGVRVIHQSAQRIVLQAGDAIVKSSTSEPLDVEAWACDRARALGILAPAVRAVGSVPYPYLVLERLPGVSLHRADRQDTAAVLHEVGRQLRVLHEVHLKGFGWAMSDVLPPRGRSQSWVDEIETELMRALGFLESLRLLDTEEVQRMWAAHEKARPRLRDVTDGRFLHGDVQRTHILSVGARLTGLVDWADLHVGDPAWDLVVAHVHFAARIEGAGMQAVRARWAPRLDDVLAGYEPDEKVSARLQALLPFYSAYRIASVIPGFIRTGIMPDPALSGLHRAIANLPN